MVWSCGRSKRYMGSIWIEFASCFVGLPPIAYYTDYSLRRVDQIHLLFFLLNNCPSGSDGQARLAMTLFFDLNSVAVRLVLDVLDSFQVPADFLCCECLDKILRIFFNLFVITWVLFIHYTKSTADVVFECHTLRFSLFFWLLHNKSIALPWIRFIMERVLWVKMVLLGRPVDIQRLLLQRFLPASFNCILRFDFNPVLQFSGIVYYFSRVHQVLSSFGLVWISEQAACFVLRFALFSLWIAGIRFAPWEIIDILVAVLIDISSAGRSLN